MSEVPRESTPIRIPAVCPSAWTAYDLQIEAAGSGNSRLSSAWCCPSGFTPTGNAEYYQGSAIRACAQTLAQNTSLSSAWKDHGRELITTQLLETPWLITWAKSDTKTLSPRPPSLGDRCTRAEISTWVPGAKVSESDRICYQSEHGPDWLGSSLFWFLVVGLPVIVITIPSVWCCCILPGRKKRRERRAQDKREIAARVANAAVPGTQRVHELSGDPYL
ncbi:hypothetical protein LMH87_009373 [Akanthomyces muscarius]|uniref:Uncharacterized protein n=1 Tax=Akanthomyces muscarius TaxID=2231603 RepID=A0A9W8QB84_AKAMU|nr:hypothetical protein LMH87_009373 [Akanthomyces muscarius]KAJ4152853.1 hypothetical protein LMH87_009373 [Akanthomyces muscarius]